MQRPTPPIADGPRNQTSAFCFLDPVDRMFQWPRQCGAVAVMPVIRLCFSALLTRTFFPAPSPPMSMRPAASLQASCFVRAALEFPLVQTSSSGVGAWNQVIYHLHADHCRHSHASRSCAVIQVYIAQQCGHVQRVRLIPHSANLHRCRGHGQSRVWNALCEAWVLQSCALPGMVASQAARGETEHATAGLRFLITRTPLDAHHYHQSDVSQRHLSGVGASCRRKRPCPKSPWV